MTTLKEFMEFAESLPEDMEKKPLSPNKVFDSVVMADKLKAVSSLDGIEDVLMKVSEGTQDKLSNMSYYDPALFTEDFSAIPIDDKNTINAELYSKEKSGVEDLATAMAADKVSKMPNVEDAAKFIDTFRANFKKTENLLDPNFQKAVFFTQDLESAHQLNNLHRNYDATIKEFNAEWVWHLAEKASGNKIKMPKSKSLADFEDNYDVDSVEGKLLNDVEWAEMQKFSTESLSKMLKTKEDWLNYATAKQFWMHEKYGYPLDYTSGRATDEGTAEGMYPFVSAALAGATAPGKGISLAYSLAAAALDAPMTDGIEYALTSDASPAVKIAGTVLACMFLGPKAEKALATVLKTPQYLGKTAIKGGNKLQQLARLSKAKDGIKISDEAGNFMYDIANGNYAGTDIEKLMPDSFGGLGNTHEYLMPQNMWNRSSVELMEVTEDNMDLAKASMGQLEHNDMQSAIRGEMDKRLFKSYREEIKEAIDSGDLDTCIRLLGEHIDDAHNRANNIIDTTPEFVSNTDPKWFQHVAVSLLPEDMKEAGLYIPNALVNQANAVAKSADMIADGISRMLKPSASSSDKRLKEFNKLIRLADDGEIELGRFIERSDIDPTVRRAIVHYRKLNDMMHEHTNNALITMYKADGVKEVRGRHVKILDAETNTVVDINTRQKFIAPADEIKEVTNVLPYSENFSHRHVKGNTIVVSKLDKATGKYKTIDTFPSKYAAHKYIRKSGLEADYAVHKVGEDINREVIDRRYASIVNNAKDDYVADKDKLMSAFHDLGISEVSADVVDDLLKDIQKVYNIDDLERATPKIKMVGKTRSREKAFSYGLEEPLESFKSYARLVSRALIEEPYIAKYKKNFFTNYGKYLDNGADYTSKLDIPTKVDKVGSIQKSGRLHQQRLINMERVPHPKHIEIQRSIDQLSNKLYAKDTIIGDIAGLVVEKTTKNIPLISMVRSASYTAVLALNAKQIPLQASFAQFGLIAHGDEFIKNPKMLGSYAKDGVALGTSIMADKIGKLGKFVKLSPDLQAMKKEIYDGGYIDDILGTERGGGKGLIKTMSDYAMAPVALGEFGNRMSNITLAMKLAESKGYKIGSKEYRNFVSTYYSKYSQVLNHLTNSPLTTHPYTSWNIGMFKKFQLQWFDQFWSGLSTKQKVFAGVGGYLAYGKFGIPGASDAVELYNVVEEQMTPHFIARTMQVMENVENLKEEDGIAYIKERYADNPEVMNSMLKKFKADFKTKGEIVKRINNLRMGDLYAQDKPKSAMEGMLEATHKVLNYEGYFDNLAVDIGWRSQIEQGRTYGWSSLFGPFVNTIAAGLSGNTVSKFSELVAHSDGLGVKPITDAAFAEANRLASILGPSPYKKGEALIDFGEIIGAAYKDELRDAEGNLMPFTKVFDKLDTQLGVPFEEQRRGQMGKTVLKPTTSLSDLLWKVAGFKGEELAKMEKDKKDVDRYQKFVLDPRIDRTAELAVYFNMKGDVAAGLAIAQRFRTYIMHKHGPDSLPYKYVLYKLKNRMEMIEWSRTKGGTEWNELQKQEIEEVSKQLRMKRY